MNYRYSRRRLSGWGFCHRGMAWASSPAVVTGGEFDRRHLSAPFLLRVELPLRAGARQLPGIGSHQSTQPPISHLSSLVPLPVRSVQWRSPPYVVVQPNQRSELSEASPEIKRSHEDSRHTPSCLYPSTDPNHRTHGYLARAHAKRQSHPKICKTPSLPPSRQDPISDRLARQRPWQSLFLHRPVLAPSCLG